MTIYRCSAVGKGDGLDQFQFGLHLSKAAGTIDGAMTAFTDFATKLWNGNAGTPVGLTGYYDVNTAIKELVVTSLDPVTGKNVEQLQASINLAGTGVDPVLPGEVAVCVSLRTALPTRAGRGRFYLPNPVNSVTTAGLLDNAVCLDFVQSAQYALQALVTSTYVPVIYHSGPKTSTAITSVDVGNVPDVQRRRRNKLVESRFTEAL